MPLFAVNVLGEFVFMMAILALALLLGRGRTKE